MGFLKRNEGSEQQAPVEGQPVTQQEQERAQAVAGEAPSAGSYDAASLADVPEAGRARMERMRRAAEAGFFTSDLSANEHLLVREAGFEPLGLVLGSSIYHIGYQQSMWNQSQEMAVLTQAMYHARELAMTRMEQEADQLGAD